MAGGGAGLGWAAAAGAAALWGAADPLLRRAAARGAGGGLVSGAGALAVGVNLAGTGLFYVALALVPLAAAAPAVNGLALALTAVVAKALGEDVRPASTVPGVLLVAVGVFLCSYDAMSETPEGGTS